MPASLKLNNDTLEVSLAGLGSSQFQDCLERVRSVSGRRWDPNRKLWVLPAEAAVAERLILTMKPELDQETEDWVRKSKIKEAAELTFPLPEDASLLIPWATGRAPWQPESIRVGDEDVPFNGLMKHQRPAVDALAKWQRAILGDDPGLGKTAILISTIEEWRQRKLWAWKDGEDRPIVDGPRLVIAPASVKGGWARELRLWLGEDVPVMVVDGSTKKARDKQIDQALSLDPNVWIITNYEMVRAKKTTVERTTRIGTRRRDVVWEFAYPRLKEIPWLAVIADEIHRAKNRNAQATRGLWKLKAPLMFGATGTAIMNRPDELWSQLAWLWPESYHERGAAHHPNAKAFWTFYSDYTDFHEVFGRKEIIGVKNPEGLRFELKNKVIRRTQGQVLDLPGKIRIAEPVELSKPQRALYAEAEKKMWLEVEQAAKGGDKSAQAFVEAASRGEFGSALYRLPNGAARTVRLRQIIETPANLGAEDDSAVLDACVDRILDSGENQWAVFCEFKTTVDCLMRRLEKAKVSSAAYTGDVSSDARTKLENAYQVGDIQVMVGTTMAMYQGITLTAGNHQWWNTLPWNPEVRRQGEDRQNRIGQSKTVMVHYAMSPNTISTTKVEPKLAIKSSIVSAVLPQDPIQEKASV